jgi:hypothetical protein
MYISFPLISISIVFPDHIINLQQLISGVSSKMIKNHSGNWYNEPIYGHKTEGRSLTPPQEYSGITGTSTEGINLFSFHYRLY